MFGKRRKARIKADREAWNRAFDAAYPASFEYKPVNRYLATNPGPKVAGR